VSYALNAQPGTQLELICTRIGGRGILKESRCVEEVQGAMVVMDRVRQMVCGLHGHDSLLQFEQDRMFLRCASCGHETPGWELNEAPPTVAVRSETRATAVMRPQLINERRVA
jgi:hypothetical protein